MKKLLVILSVLVLAACNKAPAPTATSNTFTPTFVVDYNKCGTDPVISGNSVTFGEGSTCEAGRLVSQQGYVNITQIKATVDLSKLSQNYVNASFYMVSNPVQPSVQPKGTNYCDAGGNGTQWNCQEIDMIETNGNKITQSTLHLGTGGQEETIFRRTNLGQTLLLDFYPFHIDNRVILSPHVTVFKRSEKDGWTIMDPIETIGVVSCPPVPSPYGLEYDYTNLFENAKPV